MITKQITWNNPLVDELKEKIAAHKIILADRQENLITEKARLNSLEEIILILKDHIEYENLKFNHNKASLEVKNYLEQLIDGYNLNIRSVNSTVEESIRLINQYNDSIAIYVDKLNAIPNTGTVTLTLEKLKNQIKNIPNIEPRSISFSTDEEGDYIKVKFTKLLMVPDNNPYTWITSDFSKLSIPLKPMLVKIYPKNGLLRILPTKKTDCLYSWGGIKTPHPHILDHYTPCLGDFGGPFREAIDDGDWNTALTLIRLFLTHANTDDIAGGQWVKYFASGIRSIIGKLPSYVSTYCKYSDIFYTFHETDKPGNYEITSRNSESSACAEVFPHPFNT